MREEGNLHALELDRVTVRFPDGEGWTDALRDVSLDLALGEFLAVTGPSGSGKSTLLAVAGLLLTPTEGAVRLAGADVTDNPARTRTDLRRNDIGFVFQQPHLLGSLTALEQLQLAARLDGDRSKATTARAKELLEQVGLGNVMHKRPSALSGGQRQRVGIARALMGDPRLLLVDEPTSALDHERGIAIIDLLRDLTIDRGLGTLVVTHDLGTLCPDDEVVRLVDGRLGRLAEQVPAAAP
ncbi:MAG TPA: ABC transporter ATP-binding protein [Flexivirga sp.]|uniref:ABC transporter ATP-binding protein n=1 Tax=Flexivirga sp. TaxID=1962927 RepID=UPI002CFC403C|nr:ABC transporter ATP-binding protein [Flexivirga sp.]HWC22895.1 ABC transporter ATP-binding protein [Flexivirga sp.]